LFLVISPLVTLNADLRRRLLELGIDYGHDQLDPSSARLVSVSAHIAGTADFLRWATSDTIQARLCRICIEEAHKILTDKQYRECF
jgi:hypothetical protein